MLWTVILLLFQHSVFCFHFLLNNILCSSEPFRLLNHSWTYDSYISGVIRTIKPSLVETNRTLNPERGSSHSLGTRSWCRPPLTMPAWSWGGSAVGSMYSVLPWFSSLRGRSQCLRPMSGNSSRYKPTPGNDGTWFEPSPIYVEFNRFLQVIGWINAMLIQNFNRTTFQKFKYMLTTMY